MHFTLVFVLFATFSRIEAVRRLASHEEEQVFEDYLRKFNIKLGRAGDSDKLKENVLRRFYQVEQHNELYAKGESTFTEELNKFAIMSNAELAKYKLGFRGNETSSHSSEGQRVPQVDTERNDRSYLPHYWNWADKGIVRPVQDQGLCNACYAFAALGAIEGAACLKAGQCSKLSEQEAMECTSLCDGGWDDWVYTYSRSNYGCTSAAYPYRATRLSACSAASMRRRVSNTRVTGWHTMPADPETIRHYLYESGPMFMTFYVYENFFSYRSGIYSSTDGSQLLGGHAVLLTGYGTENGIDYWILRNSWGVNWGERGYFRLQRGVNLCNCESWKVTLPIVN